MSVEVVDPLDKKDAIASCFSNFDPSDDACTKVCIYGKKDAIKNCQADTKKNQMIRAEALNKDDESTMAPIDYLRECLKGRFDVDEGHVGIIHGFRIREGKKTIGTIKVSSSGRVQIVAPNGKLQLENGFQSCKQVKEVFNSVILA